MSAAICSAPHQMSFADIAQPEPVANIRSGAEIKVGDRLFNAIDGEPIGEVRAMRPYTGPLIDLLGAGTQIATLFGGVSMTFPAASFFGVAA